MKTRRDLCDRALDNLGVLDAGQSAEVEDLASVDSFVETTIDDLRERDVFYFPDTEEFDSSVFEDLAVCLASNARHKFGLAGDPRLPASALNAEKNLRIKSAQGPTYQTAKTVYF